MAGEFVFGTLRQEALAAFLAAAGEAVTAVLGGHAGAEAVLLRAGAFGALESAFGHDWTWLGRKNSRPSGKPGGKAARIAPTMRAGILGGIRGLSTVERFFAERGFRIYGVAEC